MNDLIHRQDAIDAVSKACFELRGVFERCEDALKALPSAQSERKKGKWIEANTHTYGIYECTACKAWSYIPNEPRDYNFCPRCGADMREVDDERPD